MECVVLTEERVMEIWNSFGEQKLHREIIETRCG